MAFVHRKKEEIPMDWMTQLALAVKDESNAPGSTATIPREIDTGIAIIRHITNNIKTTTADIYFSFLFLALLSIASISSTSSFSR